MMIPKISVVMSVFNGEKHLEECIESILNQSFQDFEFIIINDCSTDTSSEIIEKYKDYRCVIVNNKENIGLTKSLNIGLKIARGKYIARIDADDSCLPNRLEVQYSFLEKHEDIFLTGSGVDKVDENGNIIMRQKILTDCNKIKKKLYFNNCLNHPTIMFRNEGFTYREKFIYSQDYDFYLRLLSNNKKIMNISDSLVKYRINPEAISWSQKPKQLGFKLKAREFYHQRLKCGRDEYEKFDPSEIMGIDVEKSTNELVLKSEIEAKLKVNEFKKVRNICRKYFVTHGFLNKVFIYYLLTFFGKRFVNMLRKILFS